MKINRLIALGFFVCATVFASFFGGSFSYAIFYASIAVPLSCIIYVIFVFMRLKVHQAIDNKTVIKGEKVGYKFIFTNETFVNFVDLKVEFLSDYSKVEAEDFKYSISLAPGQKIENLTELTCLYRGEYKVGLKAVIIRDYLGIFSMKMKYPSTTNMRVYPRVVKLRSLSALSFNDDIKLLPFSLNSGSELDNDLHSFELGDNIKTINWKVSAKQGELLARRRIEPAKEKISIFIDTAPIEGEMKIPLEDRILEIALSVADFYFNRRIEVEIIYATSVLNRSLITKRDEFSRFYDACLTLPFQREDTHDILKKISFDYTSILILVSSEPVKFLSGLSLLSGAMQTCVILAGNHESDRLSEIRKNLGKTSLIHIPDGCELSNILN